MWWLCFIWWWRFCFDVIILRMMFVMFTAFLGTKKHSQLVTGRLQKNFHQGNSNKRTFFRSCEFIERELRHKYVQLWRLPPCTCKRRSLFWKIKSANAQMLVVLWCSLNWVTGRRRRISIRNREEHFSDRANYIHTIIFSLFLLLVIWSLFVP